MGFFGFGTVSSALYFPFICPILNLIQNLLLINLNIPYHLFLSSSLLFFANIFGIFIELISISLQKSENVHTSKPSIFSQEFVIKPFESPITKKEKKSLIYLIILSCFLEFYS